MDSGDPLVKLELVLVVPFCGDVDLLALLGELIGKVGNNPLSSALAEAV
jgi:hypothetical protein